MAEGGEVVEGTDRNDVAAMNLLLYGKNTMGIGYMALWGF